MPVKLEPVSAGACANIIPIPPQFDASNVLPQVIRRCFSGSGSGEVDLTGQFLDQVVSVSSSLAGVTAAIKASSTDSEIDLNILAAGNSVTGPGDLIFTYSFGATKTLAGAINVEVCKATAIAPTSGVHATTVTVTITGTSFDPSAAVHDVSVSGLGVNPVNVAVVDDQTITCDFIIDSGASKTVRDVTVKAGGALSACQHTLVQSFTVT